MPDVDVSIKPNISGRQARRLNRDYRKDRRRNRSRKEKRRRRTTVFLLLVLAAGMGVMLYPTFSDWWNSSRQSRAIAMYDETVAQLTEEEYAAIIAEAEAYNRELYSIGSATMLSDPERLEGYEDILDITGTGIMGYVTVDRVNIELPIYHGTSDAVLASGAGHLQGSSFPIGGENTLSVISAHRGLPSARLFTDIDQLEVGDTFTVTVLNEVYTYEVDQISIIEPTELEALYIEPGEDYCTLMTCTPYGINTHRLLVRGTRTANAAHLYITAEAYKVGVLVVALFLAIPMLMVMIIWLLISSRRRRKA